MIFSRGKRPTGRHARQPGRRSGPERQQAAAPDAPEGTPQPVEPGSVESPATGPTRPTRPYGPYDISEAPQGERRMDFGSLRIPSVTGVQLRVQAAPDGSVMRVVLTHGKSALQLTAFAAPRTEPIWDEVRAEISKSLFSEGVAVQEVDGDYGVELQARMRTKEGTRDLRFVGIDGPRWLVRADFQGPAAVDPGSAPELVRVLRGLVVDRGMEAKPAKEPLPLRLPPEMAAQVQQQTAAAAAARAGEAMPAPIQQGQAVGQRGGKQAGRKPSPRPVDGPNGAGPITGPTAGGS